MQSLRSQLLCLLFISTASSTPTYSLPSYGKDIYANWKPPGPGDYRGPCPMLNTLANHQLIPHDGGRKDGLQADVVIAALVNALNFSPDFANITFSAGLAANPQPNATWFDLKQLSVHNVLEHDASLSRADAYFGSNIAFNQAVFDQTKMYWKGPILNEVDLCNGKVARQFTSKVTNPDYTFTAGAEGFSIGEIFAFVVVFGDKANVTVKKSYAEYFVEQERLPTALGWKKQTTPIVIDDGSRLAKIFQEACSLRTDYVPATRAGKRSDFHAGNY